jgi:hypothetical protein
MNNIINVFAKNWSKLPMALMPIYVLILLRPTCIYIATYVPTYSVFHLRLLHTFGQEQDLTALFSASLQHVLFIQDGSGSKDIQ